MNLNPVVLSVNAFVTKKIKDKNYYLSNNRKVISQLDIDISILMNQLDVIYYHSLKIEL